jgi:hypothetical protein
MSLHTHGRAHAGALQALGLVALCPLKILLPCTIKLLVLGPGAINAGVLVVWTQQRMRQAACRQRPRAAQSSVASRSSHASGCVTRTPESCVYATVTAASEGAGRQLNSIARLRLPLQRYQPVTTWPETGSPQGKQALPTDPRRGMLAAAWASAAKSPIVHATTTVPATTPPLKLNNADGAQQGGAAWMSAARLLHTSVRRCSADKFPTCCGVVDMHVHESIPHFSLAPAWSATPCLTCPQALWYASRQVPLCPCPLMLPCSCSFDQTIH